MDFKVLLPIFLQKKRNTLTSPLKSLWKKPLFGLGDLSLSGDTVPSVSYALISSKHPVSIIFETHEIQMKYPHKPLRQISCIICSAWLLTIYKFISQTTPLAELCEGRHKVCINPPCASSKIKNSNKGTAMQVSALMPLALVRHFFCLWSSNEKFLEQEIDFPFIYSTNIRAVSLTNIGSLYPGLNLINKHDIDEEKWWFCAEYYYLHSTEGILFTKGLNCTFGGKSSWCLTTVI